MPLTNFPNGISSFGVPIVGGSVPAVPSGVGTVYYVDQQRGNDALDGLSPSNAMLTLSAVHAKMTANQDDTVLVFGSTSSIAVRETATLSWSKDKCHIIGMNAFNRVSHRVSIRAASGSSLTPLMTVSAGGCVFMNLHLYQGYATDEAQICLSVTGERNAWYNCHIAGGGAALAAAHAGCRSLVLAGGSGQVGENYFNSCTIGLDTSTFDAANANIEITGHSPRNTFEDCDIITYTGSSGAARVFLLVGSGGIDRTTRFSRCRFINATRSSATAMTQAMSVHASAGGVVLLDDSWFLGCTDVETTPAGNVYTNATTVLADNGSEFVVYAST
jgi:hypothetical protein